ncbi:MAG: SsrA-binding protein SmpB [Kiritimatiellae bacterium]|jgi:SsrA-binding protein|nr:SsrA-binding protein SmpB [Kiritimatiellia bacterium]MBQ2281969.1 SsrA-binding protein SmpB [Kiritimatiellia bacterium]
MAASDKSAGGRIYLARNRKALHDYNVVEKIEAGIQLLGTEVKVVRAGETSLSGAYAQIDKNNEVYVCHITIPPYDFGNRFNHDSLRTRKLLLHKNEIRRLKAFVEQKGNTIIPLSIYLVRGRVKIELGVCKGKNQVDKRETIRRRDADREASRAMSNAYKR